MAKAPHVRASEIQVDGGTPCRTINSGRLTNSASAQYGSMHVAECDLYIERIGVYIDTQFTHASSKLNIGSVADPHVNVVGIVLQNLATGYYEFDPASYLGATGRTIARGLTFAFALDAADTTGKMTAFAIVRPATS